MATLPRCNQCTRALGGTYAVAHAPLLCRSRTAFRLIAKNMDLVNNAVFGVQGCGLPLLRPVCTIHCGCYHFVEIAVAPLALRR